MGLPTLLTPGRLTAPAALAGSGEPPVEHIQDWAKQRMKEFHHDFRPQRLADRVLVVRSETGSGKSTVLPAALFRLLRGEATPGQTRYGGRSVICTQPRVITAIALARDLDASPHYQDLVLGRSLGYQTGPTTERPRRGLVYATAGVLLAQLSHWDDTELLDRYAFILVDEAHERSLASDVLLAKLKAFYWRNLGNPRLPFLVLASATFDPRKYASYFDLPLDNVFEIEGRQFPIRDRWPPHGFNDYCQGAAETALRIHQSNPRDPPERQDVLVFLPGGAEIKETAEHLRRAMRPKRQKGAKQAKETGTRLLVLIVDREAVSSNNLDYRRLKMPPSELARSLGQSSPPRRVVLATVVAETGLTIETLKYVIDTGWSRTVEAYPPSGAQGLLTRPAPRSRIAQRRGRAGRLFPGEFWPLYTRAVHAALPAQQQTEVASQGLRKGLLDLAREQVAVRGTFRVEELNLLDPPPADALAAAFEEAVATGCLVEEGEGHRLTPLGEAAAGLYNAGPAEGRLLVGTYLWGGAPADAATLLAYAAVAGDMGGGALGVRRGAPDLARQARAPHAPALVAGLPYYLARGAPLDAFDRVRLLLCDTWLEGLYVFEGWSRAAEGARGDPAALADWCAAQGLNPDRMKDFAQRREELLEEMLRAGFNPFLRWNRRLAAVAPEHFSETVVALKRCIYEAYRLWEIVESRGVHRSRQGLEVAPPPGFQDADLRPLRERHAAPALRRPRRVVTPGFSLVRVRSPGWKPDPLAWRLQAPLGSALDGYLPPDPDFLEPPAQ
jgi:hypothetical protein